MATTPDNGSDDEMTELNSDDGPEDDAEEPTIDEGDGTESITVGGIDEELAGKAPETVNLVDKILPSEQEEIAQRTFDLFESDWDSSEEFREKRAQILKLALGQMPPKEDGFSQIHYSIIMTAIVKLAARVYDQQFPSNGEFFGVRPTSAADLPRSVRVAKHMNWQILHQIPEYVPNHDQVIMQWYLYGSAFTFMYWNPVKNRPCHEMVPTEDVVLPYAYPQWANDPSMSQLPRITRIVRKHRGGADGLDAWAKTGYYSQVNVDKLYDDDDGKESEVAGNMEDGPSNPIREAIDRQSGSEKPESEKPAYRELLEQHTWWKLDEWDDEKPVIITIDRETKRLIGFVIRADEDPEDRARYNREKQANDAAHELAMQQYEADMQAYQQNAIALLGGAALPGPALPGSQAITPPPAPGASDMTAPPMPGAMTPSMPVAPVAPERKPLPAPPKLVPVNFFTHFICIPNPEGIYGFGIGTLLEGINLSADALGSALVDSAVRANMQTGIASREAKLGAGEIQVKPGTITKTELLPGEIDGAIKFLQYPKPEPTLGEVVQGLKEEAQELSGASDIMSGEVGGSNETATTTQIRISQALAAVSIQNKRYTRSRTEEGRKLARMNSVYLGDTEYFSVIDPFHNSPPSADDTYVPGQGVMRQETISRTDYLEDVAITVTADPRMASQPQRFQEAMQAIQVASQLAPVAPWLQNNAPFWAALLKNVFTAMDRPDLVALSQPPPPPPPPPPGMAQPGAGMPPPPGSPQAAQMHPGAPGPSGPPTRQGPPRPHPMPPGPRVPNAGPTVPANGPFMQQGS